MSAKRPRPAIPVLVHVDNPAEVGSVTVDTSTIEGKMDTVITNQNRIYDKIPTSGGGGSADLTTVNEKITTLATAIGPASSTSSDDNMFGHVRNLQYAVGDSTKEPSLTGNSVRDLVAQIKTTTGPITSGSADNNLFGFVKNISSTIGDCNTTITANASHLRSILYNIRQAVGSSMSIPTAKETTVRGLLTAIKENTASGGGGGSADLTTVNEKTTALAAAIGSASDDSSTVSVIGLLKSITDKY